MSKRKRSTTRQHSERLNEDDGVDPRYYFAADRNSRNQRGNHRKAWQLCSQVMQTLHFVLHGDGSDDMLNSLSVVEVKPAPDTARLLVLVQSDLPPDQLRPDTAVALLETQQGRLRMEIARSINRKKTPQLIFQFVAASP